MGCLAAMNWCRISQPSTVVNIAWFVVLSRQFQNLIVTDSGEGTSMKNGGLFLCVLNGVKGLIVNTYLGSLNWLTYHLDGLTPPLAGEPIPASGSWKVSGSTLEVEFEMMLEKNLSFLEKYRTLEKKYKTTINGRTVHCHVYYGRPARC